MAGLEKRREYCEILGVDEHASKEEIKKAYKQLALQCHPDKNQLNPEATKEFQRISEAYTGLCQSDDDEDSGDDLNASGGISLFQLLQMFILRHRTPLFTRPSSWFSRCSEDSDEAVDSDDTNSTQQQNFWSCAGQPTWREDWQAPGMSRPSSSNTGAKHTAKTKKKRKNRRMNPSHKSDRSTTASDTSAGAHSRTDHQSSSGGSADNSVERPGNQDGLETGKLDESLKNENADVADGKEKRNRAASVEPQPNNGSKGRVQTSEHRDSEGSNHGSSQNLQNQGTEKISNHKKHQADQRNLNKECEESSRQSLEKNQKEEKRKEEKEKAKVDMQSKILTENTCQSTNGTRVDEQQAADVCPRATNIKLEERISDSMTVDLDKRLVNGFKCDNNKVCVETGFSSSAEEMLNKATSNITVTEYSSVSPAAGVGREQELSHNEDGDVASLNSERPTYSRVFYGNSGNRSRAKRHAQNVNISNGRNMNRNHHDPGQFADNNDHSDGFGIGHNVSGFTYSGPRPFCQGQGGDDSHGRFYPPGHRNLSRGRRRGRGTSMRGGQRQHHMEFNGYTETWNECQNFCKIDERQGIDECSNSSDVGTSRVEQKQNTFSRGKNFHESSDRYCAVNRTDGERTKRWNYQETGRSRHDLKDGGGGRGDCSGFDGGGGINQSQGSGYYQLKGLGKSYKRESGVSDQTGNAAQNHFDAEQSKEIFQKRKSDLTGFQRNRDYGRGGFGQNRGRSHNYGQNRHPFRESGKRNVGWQQNDWKETNKSGDGFTGQHMEFHRRKLVNEGVNQIHDGHTSTHTYNKQQSVSDLTTTAWQNQSLGSCPGVMQQRNVWKDRQEFYEGALPRSKEEEEEMLEAALKLSTLDINEQLPPEQLSKHASASSFIDGNTTNIVPPEIMRLGSDSDWRTEQPAECILFYTTQSKSWADQMEDLDTTGVASSSILSPEMCSNLSPGMHINAESYRLPDHSNVPFPEGSSIPKEPPTSPSLVMLSGPLPCKSPTGQVVDVEKKATYLQQGSAIRDLLTNLGAAVDARLISSLPVMTVSDAVASVGHLCPASGHLDDRRVEQNSMLDDIDDGNLEENHNGFNRTDADSIIESNSKHQEAVSCEPNHTEHVENDISLKPVQASECSNIPPWPYPYPYLSGYPMQRIPMMFGPYWHPMLPGASMMPGMMPMPMVSQQPPCLPHSSDVECPVSGTSSPSVPPFPTHGLPPVMPQMLHSIPFRFCPPIGPHMMPFPPSFAFRPLLSDENQTDMVQGTEQPRPF